MRFVRGSYRNRQVHPSHIVEEYTVHSSQGRGFKSNSADLVLVSKSAAGRFTEFEISGASVSNHSSAIAFYLERYRQGRGDEAFHGLLELEHAALPELAKVFRESTDTPTRNFLLNVIWQYRQPTEIPLLGEALFDDESEIWQEAMDGLVALASSESLRALRRARTRRFSDDLEGLRFSEWLKEAIEQLETQLSSYKMYRALVRGRK